MNYIVQADRKTPAHTFNKEDIFIIQRILYLSRECFYSFIDGTGKWEQEEREMLEMDKMIKNEPINGQSTV